MKPVLRIAIIGTGAVGRALGSCLHVAGHQVVFVGRPGSSSESMGAPDLKRIGIFGEATIAREDMVVTSSLTQMGQTPFDYILVCTKTTANEEVRDSLSALWPSLGDHTWLVLCQNGWGNADFFAETIPEKRIANARIITGFRSPDAHTVEVTVHADPIQIGSLFLPETRALAPLCEAIQDGGIPCSPSDQIEAEIWSKLLYNCLLNPLGALTRKNYGELGRSPDTRSIMNEIAYEIFAVLQAHSSKTFWSEAHEFLEDFYTRALPPTSSHESSMLQDIRAHRKTEINSLSGAVVKLARTHRINTPVNQAMVTLIHAAESE
ncbi:MAG: 2-dehydropantoate 2-reductase [Myxococcota bacterium]|nr:2-dehydropantoate 2-reductase [Myxococcota bacterium]